MDRASQRCISIESLEPRVFLSVSDLIRNGGFQGAVSSSDWIRTGSLQADSRFTNYRSGPGYAYLSDTSGNAANSISGTMYQQLTLPAVATSLSLSFWTKITTAETSTTAKNDVMAVSLMDAGGATTLQSVATISNLDASAGYVQHTYAVPASLAGKTVRVMFNASNNATNATTFRMDDVSLLATIPGAASMRVVGYFPGIYSQFSEIDYDYVTHLNYFALSASSDGTLAGGINTTQLDDVVAQMHARGKTVSVTVGPISFSTLAASATARATFASQIAVYITAHNLDGVDIDWEPPESNSTDKADYGLLINDLYAQLHPMGKLITAAVNPYTHEIPLAATAQMDWLNIMCYDFDFANSAPYSDMVTGMNGWASYGVPKSKLVMGVPFYGRYGTSWSDTHAQSLNTILSNYQTQFGAMPAQSLDSYVDSAGNKIYFNSLDTMQQKLAFARDSGFGGTMIWQLGQDHWNGAADYDSYSELPAIGTMMNPPAWLTPSTGSTFDIANQNFYLNLGTVTFNSDAWQTTPDMSVNVLTGTTATFDASQRLTGLSVSGTGKIDIKSNNIVVDYSGTTPIGAWNGSNYTGLQGLIRSGRNGGAWNGSGIVTSTRTAIAPSKLSTIGIAEASDALGITAAQTKVWNGRTVDGSTVLIKFTYAGDANLDGAINGDDYFLIDSHAGMSGGAVSYAKGDFNLDGKVNADDYFIIDSNYSAAAAGGALAQPLSRPAGAEIPQATAVSVTASQESAYTQLTDDSRLSDDGL